MKRFILSKSMLCLFLLGMVCNVAWADFTQKWTKSPVGPWGTTDLTAEQYPVEVGNNLVTAQGSQTGTVRKAEVKVTKTLAGDVTILFTYDTGGHKLNILGVDLVGADGKVKYSDYHYGKAPGDGTTNDYTLTGVAAGDYTLRYFVCNNSNDKDQLTSTIGNITVNGLIHQELLYNEDDGKYNDRPGSTSNWRNGWVSTNIDKPSLNISVVNNNVNANCADYIGLRPGDSGCTYTITTGVQIKSLSFEAITASTSNETHVITIGGVAKNVGTDWTEFTIDNINSTSTTFQMGGNTNKNSYDCLVRNIKITLKEDAKVNIVNANDFVNGGVYTFVTGRGWVGANDGDNAIGTVKTSVTPAASASNAMFQWTVYKSKNGNYYLYNIGKQKFLGAASNGVFPFVETPTSKELTFKNSSVANYPIMFSTDNTNAVTQNKNSGLFAWSGGWNNLNDEGSNHKVTLVKALTDAELETIANLVENYDKSLPFKVDVDGWNANNPNTHFGNIVASQGELVSTTKATTDNMNVSYVAYNNIGDAFSFTRPYRGFEFQGFYLGEQELGKSFELTDALKTSITEANPIIAKFTATSDVTLFYDDDPYSYRIPAITTTGTGRIVAVSDYRHNLDDIGRDKHSTGTMRIDLVMRYSDNNGQTWSETQTIAAGDNSKTGSYLRAFGDAAIAAVGQNIVVMAAAGDQLYPDATTTSPNKMARIFSSDNGETWTITEMTTKMYTATGLIPDGVAAFFGSGKMVVDANYNDTQKARIYGALLVRRFSNNKYSNYNNYVVYSDDLGETWNILGGSQTPVAGGDEPKVEILPNGQILLSARRGGGRVFNVFTYTDKANNAGTWDTAANGCGNGGSNATNGEIFCVDAKKVDGTAVKLLMQSQPKGGGGQYDRKDVTIWYKEIDANTTYTTATIKDNWTEGLQVSSQQSSYSAVTMQPNGKIALFFEEAPCYADDYTKGYSMVYVPLTIENITKGNYFAPTTDLNETRTINVKLTDTEGNVYNDVIEGTIAGIGETVTTKYSFITLGDNAGINVEGETYTYTNSVTLPFKVSNGETTIWHNIYFPSFNNPAFNPIYLSAESNNATVKTCKENVPYGQSSFNTLEHADEISWAIYQSGNGFNFKFKNKLVDKYIKAIEVGNTSNTVFDEESKATTFEIMSVPGVANNRKAGYALKAIVGGTTGYLCCTSSNNGYATHYSSHEHAGGRVNFVEAPDFEALIAEVNAVLNLFGDGLGQYSNVSEENLNAVNEAKQVMANASSVNKSVLDTYKTYEEKTDGATLNMPQPGQYFRVAYDYGGSVGKLYMQGVASTVKGVKFTEEKDNASVWVYNDGTLTSYYDGRNLREVNDDRGLSDAKTTVTFSKSTRAKGKYNVKVGSFVHANSSNSNYFTDHCDKDGGHGEHDLILEEAEVAVENVLIGDWEIGTFYANGAMEIPEGVSAYVATAEPVMEGETGVITLTKIQTGVVPAKTGVIITGKPGYYDFTSITSGASVGENFMCGYAGPETMKKVTLTNDASYYILTVVNSTPGFYKKAYDFNVYNNKAYLKLPTTVAASLRFRFNNNDGTTDIIEVPTEALNGNVEIYDLSGRRVEKAGKGVYIVNGKKVIF